MTTSRKEQESTVPVSAADSRGPLAVGVEGVTSERVPLHRKIRDTLRREITDGERPPYSELPSEQALATQFGTTRMTVRQSIAALEHEGLVEKAQGRRTVVCPEKTIERLISLHHDTASQDAPGKKITYRLLRKEFVAPPSRVRRRMSLPWTVERVICFSRIRYVDDVPVSVYASYLLPDRFPGFLDEDTKDRSLIKIIREDYGTLPVQIHHELEVMTADDQLSELLNVREGCPILLVESIECGENGVPFVYHTERYRADRYRFRVKHSQPGREMNDETNSGS